MAANLLPVPSPPLTTGTTVIFISYKSFSFLARSRHITIFHFLSDLFNFLYNNFPPIQGTGAIQGIELLHDVVWACEKPRRWSYVVACTVLIESPFLPNHLYSFWAILLHLLIAYYVFTSLFPESTFPVFLCPIYLGLFDTRFLWRCFWRLVFSPKISSM